MRTPGRAGVDKALADAGDAVTRTVVRSSDTQNTMADKVRMSVSLADADQLPPRETTTLGMEVDDVERALASVRDAAIAYGGRTVDATLSKEKNGRVIGKVVVDVPLAKAMEMVTKTRDLGRVQIRRDAKSEQVPDGRLARARLDVTLANADLIVGNDRTLASTIRGGLGTSVQGLLWSVRLIVIGLCLILPWVLLLWLGWRLLARGRRTTTTTNTTPPPPSTPAPTPA